MIYSASGPDLLHDLMFKFEFNIDDADDLEEISSTSKIRSLPSDKPSPNFEPFAEVLIDHLVRVNVSNSSTD